MLANGAKTVVKVQRPDARELIEQDLALLEVFADKAGDRPGLKQVIDLRAVFEHLSVSLHHELDFRNEARNVQRMGQVIASFDRLAVPVLYTDFSTGRLLVMGDVGGGPISIAPDGPVRSVAAKQLLESFYKQVMVDGFFHADPHPGNLMWQPDEDRLYFLDLGMAGEVGPELRESMMLLLMAFWQDDVGFLTDITLMMAGAIDRSDLDVEAFQGEIGQLMAKYQGASIQDIQLGPVLQEMTEISLRYGVPLPASLTLTAKALAQMQLAASQLDPTVDPFDVAGKFLMRSVLTGMGTKIDPKTLFYQLQTVEGSGPARDRGGRASDRRAPGGEARGELPSGVPGARRSGGRAGASRSASLLRHPCSARRSPRDAKEAWLPITLGAIGLVFTVGLLMDLVRDRRDHIL